MNPELRSLVESILKQPVLDIRDFHKGLTNRNYLVTLESMQVVLRVPPTDAHRIVFREHELKAHTLIATTDLDVETLYFDPETGIKMTRYIPDLKTFSEYTGEDKIARTASLMRKLHALKQTIGVSFDPVKRYRQYASHVKYPMVCPLRAESIIHNLEKLESDLTLCHNDWVPGNICFTPEKDYLIDYEYAGDNDPFFDVMSFITENDLTQEEKQEFLDAYFQREITAAESLKLHVYEDFHNLLWNTWALMMFESRNEDIYKTIAELKYSALTEKKPE